MKYIITIFFIAITIFASAQTQISSGVYNWDTRKPDSAGLRKYFSGQTKFFNSFLVCAITLVPTGTLLPSLASSKDEQLIIIKEGTLSVSINNEKTTLGPGSIAHIMPGDMPSFENEGKSDVILFFLKFNSGSLRDDDRGKVNGGSFVVDSSNVERIATEKGFRRNFYDRPTSMTTNFEMHVTTLKEGLSSHAAHTHPQEEIILLLRGNAHMEIDGQYYDAAPGALVFLASGIPHALHNSGTGACEYFAFQWK